MCAYEPNSASAMLRTTLWGGALMIDVLGIEPSLSGLAASALAY